jgi:hypothetical protein
MEPIRVMLIYADGFKAITNTTKLFGNPLLFFSEILMPGEHVWGSGRFKLEREHKDTLIYREVVNG